MIEKGCKFCNDSKNIIPASYVSVQREDMESKAADFILHAKENKQFLLFAADNLFIIDKCPKCGYVFTEEDYNSYT